MTLSAALKKIFLENKEKLFTSEDLKDRVRQLTGHYPIKSQWFAGFLDLRENHKFKDGYVLCKLPFLGGWHYTLTKSERLISIHNKSIKKQQQTLETRKL